MMRDYFYGLVDTLNARLHANEVLLAYLSAEDSTFVRFNKNAVRQAGGVKQIGFDLSLIKDQRRAQIRLTLAGEHEADITTLRAALDRLRVIVGEIPADPYLLYNTTPASSEHEADSGLASDEQLLDAVMTAGAGKDLVGIYAAGVIYKGFANSLGQRNWHRVENFNFDWSLYHAADKAVKTGYAGTHWNDAVFQAKMTESARQLAHLAKPSITLSPGEYRVFFTPKAVSEVTELLSWGSFSVKSQRKKQSALIKLEDGSATLDASINISENASDGIAAAFSADGFLRAPNVPLIANGKHAQSLVSPRSAQEYGLITNGANASEGPESLDMAAGTLAMNDALRTLDTGIYIGNLHYLNYSDPMACRMTGMTRFATFWVENGEIKAPLNVMRFDDSVYRMFGENLVGLTAERDLILDSGSYGERSTGSARLPGALLSGFALTL